VVNDGPQPECIQSDSIYLIKYTQTRVSSEEAVWLTVSGEIGWADHHFASACIRLASSIKYRLLESSGVLSGQELPQKLLQRLPAFRRYLNAVPRTSSFRASHVDVAR
jgi:hypothetical protein